MQHIYSSCVFIFLYISFKRLGALTCWGPICNDLGAHHLLLLHRCESSLSEMKKYAVRCSLYCIRTHSGSFMKVTLAARSCIKLVSMVYTLNACATFTNVQCNWFVFASTAAWSLHVNTDLASHSAQVLPPHEWLIQGQPVNIDGVYSVAQVLLITHCTCQTCAAVVANKIYVLWILDIKMVACTQH